MGEVWRAHDSETDRIVALKLLPAHFSDDEEFQRRFRREAHAAARLNNPHIIPIHHYGEIEGQLYVDMRLIEGRDLQAVLGEGPLAPARAVRIIEQVAKAVHAAHQAGLLHRDIKPSNILLDDDDFAYLIDFGIARAINDTRMTKYGNPIGTFEYIAPERLDNQAEEDARADVYSLACVLYEALTGHPPFPGDTMAQLVAAHLHIPPPQVSVTRPDVPPEVDQVIATGMAKDPDHRYTTTVELADAARDAITMPLAPRGASTRISDPTTARAHADARLPPAPDLAATHQRPVSPSPAPAAGPADYRPFPIGAPPQRPSRRRPSWLIAVLGVVVIGVGLVVYGPVRALLHGHQPPTPTPTAQPAPAPPTAQPTPPSAGPVSTPASPSAEVPGLAPYVGVWQAHTGRVVIDSTGTGRLTYRGCTACTTPTENTIDFALTSVANGFASGAVTASSDAFYTVGAPVTAHLAAVLPGQLLEMTVKGIAELPFCNGPAEAAGQCGA
ncbi:hypothetical protein AWC29_09060 [Mycobacterium triplex]|nr:hypothetical protein AWC29_09060 [Mycobacterium triplex]